MAALTDKHKNGHFVSIKKIVFIDSKLNTETLNKHTAMDIHKASTQGQDPRYTRKCNKEAKLSDNSP